MLGVADAADRPRAVMVDRALAERLWPNESAVGRRLEVSVSLFDRGYRVERVPAEIVGVVGTVAAGRADDRPPGTIYLPHAQQPLWNMAFVMATERRPEDAVAAARTVLRQIDGELPIYDVRPMDDIVARTMASTRMVLSSLAAFAGVAAVLASVGLYAVIAYIVRQRRKELSIRIALGATPRSLGIGVLREGLTLVACGVALGVALALAAGGALATLVVGVPPRDPPTLIAVSLLLFAAGALSTFVPAYRASAVDPVAGLREE
jgi:hypothetical protein